MILEAVKLGRRADDRWLLDDVSLALRAGERLAVVGPSGSGKTLLLRALALLDPLDAGELRWQGHGVPAGQLPAFRSRVMYLPQRPALAEGTVEHNLRQPFELRVHREKQYDGPRVAGMLAALGRDESFLVKKQSDLSGGEAQLAALLRAVQLDPDVLLLDEPTAALDAEATEMVETLVANWLNDQPGRRATIWVTHDREQARRVSDSLFRIRDGCLDGAT